MDGSGVNWHPILTDIQTNLKVIDTKIDEREKTKNIQFNHLSNSISKVEKSLTKSIKKTNKKIDSVQEQIDEKIGSLQTKVEHCVPSWAVSLLAAIVASVASVLAFK